MSKTEGLKLRLRHLDYLCQVLEFDWPGGVRADTVSATVTVTQPYGFEQKLTSQALRRDGRGEVEIVYPLIDDGRFAPVRKFGPWKMGRYRFELNLKAGRRVVGRGALNVDPNAFFGEIGGQKLAQVDSLRQFIECCTERAVFIDHEEVGFTIRTIPERVKTCTVEVDVVRAKDGVRKAGPIRLNLDRKIKKKRFDGAGWSPGEYWLRVRAIRNAQPAGPYMVRQFWMERPFRPKEPELPQRPGDRPQLLVDGWIFSSSKGLRHEPDQLERLSDGPVFELDRPWEVGPRGAGISSFSWDEEAKQFRVTYTSGPIPDDPRLWKIGVASGLTQFSTRYICLAVSGDGVHWEKPELGIVEYNGSKRNNILRDTAGEGYLLSGEYDSYPVPVKERPLPRKYRYRFYDAKRDGPVDMDNFAFRVFMERSWEPDDQREGGFRPQDRTFYGMERRGDLFLVLSRRPVLYGGRGMNLRHTTERASTYPFEGEPAALFRTVGGGSTSNYYHRKSKTFYYYFRPDCPPYPPNGLPYYLWHQNIAALRTRAVLWTQDGFNWGRRHMAVPDEYDAPGTTLYGFGHLAPWGRHEMDPEGQLDLGALLYWDLATQLNRQEMMWSRDRIHWHRFGENRRPLLPGGPPGSWDIDVGGVGHFHPVTNAQGEEEWWFNYGGKNSRYMLSGHKGADTLEAFKKAYPYFELSPFFTSWEDFYEETKRSASRPGLARCKAWRLAHVEPEKSRGEFTTRPMVAEGARLLINTATEGGGSVRVEVQDAEGNVFPELALEDCVPFSGDRVAHEVRWKRARFEEVNRRVIRLRVALEGARMYTFTMTA